MRILAICLSLLLLVGCGAQAPETVPPTTTEPVQLAPDFTVYDANGNAFRLSDFRGKPVVLNFWASWCGPCKAEMPEFEDAYHRYAEQIHFLMVNLTDGNQETVQIASSFIDQQGYTFPVYFDTTGEASYYYGISAIPRTFFLDARGAYVTDTVGMMNAESLQQAIDGLLQ